MDGSQRGNGRPQDDDEVEKLPTDWLLAQLYSSKLNAIDKFILVSRAQRYHT